MSRLFIICGLPASGKTTIAKALSKELDIACLHKDIIKENLYEILELKSLEDSKKVGYQSIQLLYRLMEDFISNGIDLIVESPFNFDEDIDLFSQMQKRYNLDIYCIICEIDENIRQKRFIERPRHKAHHDTERLRLDNKTDKKTFNYNLMPGNLIKINTNGSTEELIKNLKLRLG